VSGSYQTPFWGVNVAGFYNVRDGYPSSRHPDAESPQWRGITTSISTSWVTPAAELPTLDFRVDSGHVRALTITPAMEVFTC